MMSLTPDYTTYTLAELEEVERHINRAEFPERHAIIVEELAKRRSMLWENDDEDARERKPADTFYQILTWYAIISGGLALLGMVMTGTLSTIPPSIALVSIGAAALTIIGGVAMLGRKGFGLVLSLMAQLFMVPYIIVAGYIYAIATPMSFVLRFGTLGGSMVGLNVVSLVAAIALGWLYMKMD